MLNTGRIPGLIQIENKAHKKKHVERHINCEPEFQKFKFCCSFPICRDNLKNTKAHSIFGQSGHFYFFAGLQELITTSMETRPL